MKLEHFALNVEDPLAMASWYCDHLGLKIARQMEDSPFTTFLADDSNTILLEIYKNPAAEVPTYREMNPLLVHIAFVSEDPSAEKQRLIEAGATLVSDHQLNDGTHLVMMRDPWGLAIQFCKRGEPMIR
ncbi:MAG TPA: VOC family protein [Chitinophagaceae bacterium]|nr:VOC family protein [Chitinophagaceae bacterium]